MTHCKMVAVTLELYLHNPWPNSTTSWHDWEAAFAAKHPKSLFTLSLVTSCLFCKLLRFFKRFGTQSLWTCRALPTSLQGHGMNLFDRNMTSKDPSTVLLHVGLVAMCCWCLNSAKWPLGSICWCLGLQLQRWWLGLSLSDHNSSNVSFSAIV